MARLLTIIVAVVGFGATIWNTINVEKKGTILEETDAIVSSVRQDIETREMNYRLAVQEFNFSTLHAADAYDLDSNHELLGASVAPGTTMLRKKGDAESEGGAGASVLNRARRKLDDRKRSKRSRAAGEARPVASRAEKQSRESVFARLTRSKPAPEKAATGAPTRTPPPAGRKKVTTRLRTAMEPVSERIINARPRVTTPETKHKVAMIRGFQIENLSRWRQYMGAAATGEAMTEEGVDEWEGLLAGALIENDAEALRDFVARCQTCVEEWQQNHDEGLEALQEEADKQAALEKEISRGKSIYMGLMLVVLVLVTVKDVFTRDRN